MNVKGSFKKNKKLFIILTPIIAFLLIAGILVDVITPNYETSLTVALSGTVIDDAAQSKALENGYKLNQEVEEEGIVLLRNEGNVLPISTSATNKTKLNVFGVRTAHLVYNSAGSAAGSLKEAVDLKTALEAADYEVNPNLWNLLASTAVKDNTGVNEGGSSEAVNELATSAYTGNCSFESAKSYSEYAVVVFSRIGGEGADQTRTGMGDGTYSYLELCENEKLLLQKLRAENFKVIVLINSSYAMELGPLEEYGVDAALWIGGPGVYGAYAIGTILNGTVNPSGRLADTYAYDLSTAASFYSSDKYVVKDVDGAQIGGYTDYSEGIYVGYRWYETAAAEGFWDSAYAENKWGLQNGYDDVVQYPFGYGLSYTNYTTSFKSANYADGTFTFEVDVANDTSVAGKQTVQIYAETPYAVGGVEKSKVVLAAFGKTDILDKNGENKGKQTLTLKVNLEDIASYDVTAADNVGAYVANAGDYKFYLSENAHSWAEIEDTNTNLIYSYHLDEDIVYSGNNKRSSDKTAASNHLTNGDIRNGVKINHLSRENGFANAEQAVFTKGSDITVDNDSALYKALVTNKAAIGSYKGETFNTATGTAKKYDLSDFIDTEKGYVDYDDERWEDFLSQMSVDDLVKLAGTGGWSTAKIDSIGKDRTSDIDGPFGLSNLIKNAMGIDVNCVSYCSEAVMAATFNTELIKRIGEAVAAEAQAIGVSGWYAPGANIHRTPFGGRNPEYYSEDAMLSGAMCAAEVDGALSKGLYVYIKHFAFNDTEANRTAAQNCYIDEQTVREIYLKPFETAIKNDKYDADGKRISYGATGLMVSYMWYGETWLGANNAVMTDIIRKEWGFKGMANTDNAGVGSVDSWITLTRSIYAGTDLQLIYKTGKLDSSVASSPDTLNALKAAGKHILFTIADAASRREVQAVAGFNWWRFIYVTLNIVLFGAAAILLGVLLLKLFLPVLKKESSSEGNDASTESTNQKE